MRYWARGGCEADAADADRATEFQEVWPAISPDGHWLASMSNATNRYEVYAAGRNVASLDRQWHGPRLEQQDE